MLSRNGRIALLAVIGILLVFFSPATCGPFSATNGPATAFRALAAVCCLFAAIGMLLVASTLQCKLVRQSKRTAGHMNYDPALFALRC
jgi:Na+/melibiose symporter-like transporter